MIFVVMTALPPTKGHLGLIQFASEYGYKTHQPVTVLVCTQPSEPFVNERTWSLRSATDSLNNVQVENLHRQIEQDASAPGFWDMWRDIMFTEYGARSGDTYIASEPYGKTMASVMNGKFMPYDPNREIYPCKATRVRESLDLFWADLIPDFSNFIAKTVTIFGAESTGKTTLAKTLARVQDWHYVFEYARPYLENTNNVITVESMTDIWKGQAAVQEAALRRWTPEMYTVHDTDLFSTIGYWEFPHWQERLGTPSPELIADARWLQSDIYLITPSNIPFEADPLRYGGDVREGSDEYWISVAEKYGLNYRVLKAESPPDRHDEAIEILETFYYEDPQIAALRDYQRSFNGLTPGLMPAKV